MTSTVKSGLVLIVTLLAGLGIGALGTGAVINHRMDELESLRTERGFARTLVEIIDPADEQRREQVRGVLAESAKSMAAIRSSCYVRFKAQADSVRSALLPLLTEEETARLDEWMSRDRDDSRRRRDGRRSSRPRDKGSNR